MKHDLETLGEKLTNLLEDDKTSSNEFEKLNNKYSRKKATIEKNQDILKHLQDIKDYTLAKKIKNPNKKKFSITLMKKYKRDMEYRDEFHSIIKDFYKSKGFTMDIHSISIHCDQSVIYAHILGVYNGDTTLNQDLQRIYDKSFNYLDFQIEPITKGGKKDYINLPAYKEIQQNSKKEVIQYIYNLKNKVKGLLGIDKDSYIKTLEKKLFSSLVDLKRNKYISKKLESEHKKMEEALDKLKVDATTVNALGNKINFLKSKMTDAVKEKNFYKNEL